ncbi:MAG: sulfotransferase [Halieaceae bacterium]|jgi:hypothetical protein|nr:sulfotransferase [Halieaceae bacterium]
MNEILNDKTTEATPEVEMELNTDLALESIIAEAMAETGLDDFGDESFMEGLIIYLRALEEEAQLSPLGLAVKRIRTVEILSNRLRAHKIFQEHPQILEQEIRDPVFIIGLPRTGTTKLQRMIAADPNVAFLRYYQSHYPVPWEGVRVQDPDPRKVKADEDNAVLKVENPEMFAGHPFISHEAEEETWILEHSYQSIMQHQHTYVPSYMKWLSRQDPTRCFEETRDLLKLVQWQNDEVGKQWILKCVLYNGDIDTVLKVFPNARFVCAHRPVEQQMVSWASMMILVRTMLAPDMDPSLISHDILETYAEAMDRHLILRKTLPSDRIIDICYRDICDRPFEVIRRIYDFAGWQWTQSGEQAMAAWEAENRQHKHGKRGYTLEETGLTEQEIRDRFTNYRRCFSRYLN